VVDPTDGGVEDIPGTALAEGMSWNWESFPEYLDEVERMPRGHVTSLRWLPTARCARTFLGGLRSNAEGQ